MSYELSEIGLELALSVRDSSKPVAPNLERSCPGDPQTIHFAH
jgi:hypothetical protein